MMKLLNHSEQERAFGTIVSTHSERVFNHALRMLGNREDAEEATNDVFLRIHHGLVDFRGESTLSTWIWRITTNVCLNKRSRASFETIPVDERIESVVSESDPRPDQIAEQMERSQAIVGCISKLPDVEASVVTLFYLQQLGYKEIAAVLSMPEGTIATHLHRGRERLRTLMQASKEALGS